MQTNSTKPPNIPWLRFWCSLSATINCGEDGKGFLVDPEDDFGRASNPGVCPLKDLVTDTGPLILCGDPGIGKTTELKLAKETLLRVTSPDELISLTFRLHISNMQEFRELTISSPAWERWRTGTHRLTLLIDGIDEGLIQIPNFISALTGYLEEEPVSRLRLVLTCRSAEWPTSQGESLLALWPTLPGKAQPLYELCPLRYVDVQAAAEAWEINEEKFLEELFENRAFGLATRPVTLFFLLREFKSHGRFPASHRVLYQRGIRTLINEVDPKRMEIRRASRSTLQAAPEADRMCAAQRIAALTMCCGKRSVLRPTNSTFTPSSELVLDQCVSASQKPPYTVFEEVIESALFTSVGEEQFGFMHQTFAECIASMKLAELPLQQLRSLLMRRDQEGEYVVPQLIEMTAWTAGSHTEFCSHLLRTDPTALLHCDVSVLTDDLKAQLVDALLQGADAGRILNDYALYRFFHTLKHPRLAEQLRPFIVDTAHSRDSRSFAVEIAQRCRLDEFCTELLAIVFNHADPVREDAALAVCELMPEARLAELEPLARGEAGPDRQQSIRGYALRKLVPNRWSVTEALPLIEARTDSSFYGSYHSFLEHELPGRVTVNDVAPCLEWLEHHSGSFDSLSSRNNFAKKIIHLALCHLDRSDVSDALCRLWLVQVQRHHRFLPEDSEVKLLLASDPSLRCQLQRLLMSIDRPPGVRASTLVAGFGLTSTSEDFDWLLDQLESASAKHRINWAELIASYVWHSRLLTPNWDKFLRLHSSVPALAQQLEWLRTWSIDEPLARQNKARWLRDRRNEERDRREMEANRGDDPRPVRLALLERARADAPDSWFELWRVLHWGDEPNARDPLFFLQVEECKGWKLLDHADQDLVRRSARNYLEHFAIESEAWSSSSYGALASTAALWLLRDQIVAEPALRDIAVRWIRLFAAFADDEKSVGQHLFAILNQVSHEECVATMIAQVTRSGTTALRVAKLCWDDRFDLALRHLLEEAYPFRMLGDAIDEWGDLNPMAAEAFALEKAQQCLASIGPIYPLQLKETLVAALVIRPAETFALSLPSLIADPHLAEGVWSFVLRGAETRDKAWLNLWPDEVLADLYLHLMLVLPRSQDPHHEGSFIPPRASAAWMRDRLPSELAARGTRTACAALRRLIHELPEQVINLKWNYRKALLQCRRNEWAAPSPEVVTRLLDNSESRFVRSEAELKEVILESLQRFQRHLTGRTFPAVVELWSGVPQNGSRRSTLKHKDEAALQAAVARWLRDDLGPERGVVVNCEVQPRTGHFTDINVDAVRLENGERIETMTVVIEVKGCWHPKVRTGLQTQLIEGYLRPNNWNTGIYLIGWFVCPACPKPPNKTGHKTLVAVQQWLDGEIEGLKGSGATEDLAGVVLDCSWPATAPSRSTR